VSIARVGIVSLAIAWGAAAVAASALPLTERVLRAGELAGMTASGPVRVIKGARAWVIAEGGPSLDVEIARLRKLGFIAGVRENLRAPGNPARAGLSAVEQFSSATSAKAEVVHAATANGPWVTFPVHGIPGARGFEQLSSQGNGRNVAFPEGVYYYIVGAGWGGPSSNAVSRSTVKAAALRLYQRVRGT
jgi:hypothetical protein